MFRSLRGNALCAHVPVPGTVPGTASFPPESFRMTILFINNDGSGFADHVEIADGTTVEQLFADKMPGRKAGDFLIRVNRLPAAADQVLLPGDRCSITPTKISGAV